jgi:hypothetical protein
MLVASAKESVGGLWVVCGAGKERQSREWGSKSFKNQFQDTFLIRIHFKEIKINFFIVRCGEWMEEEGKVGIDLKKFLRWIFNGLLLNLNLFALYLIFK